MFDITFLPFWQIIWRISYNSRVFSLYSQVLCVKYVHYLKKNIIGNLLDWFKTCIGFFFRLKAYKIKDYITKNVLIDIFYWLCLFELYIKVLSIWSYFLIKSTSFIIMYNISKTRTDFTNKYTEKFDGLVLCYNNKILKIFINPWIRFPLFRHR